MSLAARWQVGTKGSERMNRFIVSETGIDGSLKIERRGVSGLRTEREARRKNSRCVRLDTCQPSKSPVIEINSVRVRRANVVVERRLRLIILLGRVLTET